MLADQLLHEPEHLLQPNQYQRGQDEQLSEEEERGKDEWIPSDDSICITSPIEIFSVSRKKRVIS